MARKKAKPSHLAHVYACQMCADVCKPYNRAFCCECGSNADVVSVFGNDGRVDLDVVSLLGEDTFPPRLVRLLERFNYDPFEDESDAGEPTSSVAQNTPDASLHQDPDVELPQPATILFAPAAPPAPVASPQVDASAFLQAMLAAFVVAERSNVTLSTNASSPVDALEAAASKTVTAASAAPSSQATIDVSESSSNQVAPAMPMRQEVVESETILPNNSNSNEEVIDVQQGAGFSESPDFPMTSDLDELPQESVPMDIVVYDAGAEEWEKILQLHTNLGEEVEDHVYDMYLACQKLYADTKDRPKTEAAAMQSGSGFKLTSSGRLLVKLVAAFIDEREKEAAYQEMYPAFPVVSTTPGASRSNAAATAVRPPMAMALPQYQSVPVQHTLPEYMLSIRQFGHVDERVLRPLKLPWKASIDNFKPSMLGHVRRKHFNSQEFCSKCVALGHPTTLCDLLWEVYLRVMDRNEQDPADDSERGPCQDCLKKGFANFATTHTTQASVKGTWYDHPCNVLLEHMPQQWVPILEKTAHPFPSPPGGYNVGIPLHPYCFDPWVLARLKPKEYPEVPRGVKVKPRLVYSYGVAESVLQQIQDAIAGKDPI